MISSHQWKHIFKLDPDKPLTDSYIEAVCESGTDAVLVGGTYGVTFEKTIDLLGKIRRYSVPCVLEVSNREAIVPGFDHYYIPFVLNATNPDWILKPYQEVIKKMGGMIPWSDISVLGYCVLNEDSSVAQLTRSETNLTVSDIVAYARMARHMFQVPYFYLEYSGRYADPSFVGEVAKRLKDEPNIHLIYGGGIDHEEKARTMSSLSDTIIVGNSIYEDVHTALRTVEASKEATKDGI